MQEISIRPEAQRKIDGLSPIAPDVLEIIWRKKHWDITDQIVRFCKPLVDAIGNLESRDATFADCMLEILRCARHMMKVESMDFDDLDFSEHARSTFSHGFHTMNTELAWFTMFLHPWCRQLAISQAHKSRSLNDAMVFAATLAHKWGWEENTCEELLKNIKDYYHIRKPFEGGHANALLWWQDLYIKAKNVPLKSMAAILFGLVPHSAEVERLFSNLGGIQGTRRSRLSVNNFETLGKLRTYYTAEIREKAIAEGQPIHRRTNAHVHTREGGGIDEELSKSLEEEFTFKPVLSTMISGENEELVTPEDITLDDIDKAFDELDRVSADDTDLEDASMPARIDVEDFYDLEQLDKALVGQIDVEEEDHGVHHHREMADGVWDVASVLARVGCT